MPSALHDGGASKKHKQQKVVGYLQGQAPRLIEEHMPRLPLKLWIIAASASVKRMKRSAQHPIPGVFSCGSRPKTSKNRRLGAFVPCLLMDHMHRTMCSLHNQKLNKNDLGLKPPHDPRPALNPGGGTPP